LGDAIAHWMKYDSWQPPSHHLGQSGNKPCQPGPLAPKPQAMVLHAMDPEEQRSANPKMACAWLA
jgi:hypothetical protein